MKYHSRCLRPDYIKDPFDLMCDDCPVNYIPVMRERFKALKPRFKFGFTSRKRSNRLLLNMCMLWTDDYKYVYPSCVHR